MSLDQLGAGFVSALLAGAIVYVFGRNTRNNQADKYEQRIRSIIYIDDRDLKAEQAKLEVSEQNAKALNQALLQANQRNIVLEAEKGEFIRQLDRRADELVDLSLNYETMRGNYENEFSVVEDLKTLAIQTQATIEARDLQIAELQSLLADSKRHIQGAAPTEKKPAKKAAKKKSVAKAAKKPAPKAVKTPKASWDPVYQ